MNLGPQRFEVPVKVDVMYLLLPLLFSQIIVLHKMISFPPHYFFILFLIPLLPALKKNSIASFVAIYFFLLMSAWADNAFREASQIAVEMAFGYIIAQFFIRRYSHFRLQVFFKRTLYLWAGIIIIYMCDFYFFDATLNGFSQLITDWKSGGTSTVFARISIIWGNPNWLSFFYLIAFALYVEFNGRSLSISLLAVIILFVLQTKTAIGLGALLLLFVLISAPDRKLNWLISLMAGIFIFGLLFSYGSDIVNLVYRKYSDPEFSSFVNRVRIWDFISPYLKWYPNGLMGDGTKQALILASDEDTLPSIFLLLRLFGWPIVLIALIFLMPLNKNTYLSPVTFILLGYSLTQSYLSISASCSLAFFALFLSISRIKNSRKRYVCN